MVERKRAHEPDNLLDIKYKVRWGDGEGGWVWDTAASWLVAESTKPLSEKKDAEVSGPRSDPEFSFMTSAFTTTGRSCKLNRHAQISSPFCLNTAAFTVSLYIQHRNVKTRHGVRVQTLGEFSHGILGLKKSKIAITVIEISNKR